MSPPSNANGTDTLQAYVQQHRLRGTAEKNIFIREESDTLHADGGNIHIVALIFGLPLVCTYSHRHAVAMVRNDVSHRPAAPFLVTFVNPLAVKLVGSDPAYHANIHRMNLVFCDGIALAWAAGRIARYPIERISFDSTSLAPSVFGIAQDYGRMIALVGGRPGVAGAAAARIRELFPRLRIVAAADGYRPVDELVRTIVDLDPDIVVCGMGAPHQEEFLVALAEAGWCGTGFTCGGYLDHLVDGFDFYPAIVNRLNLRWLYRLAREPKRIGYRVVFEYAPFWRAAGRELLRGACSLQRQGRHS
jgi:N-acetylglucosaminyldiphosphoundecaprenol N-acetyl-beta-D-mannosaminyltransferase